MKKSNTTYIRKLLSVAAINLLVVLTGAVGSVSAQSDPGTGTPVVRPTPQVVPQSSPGSAPGATRTRDRRAAEAAAQATPTTSATEQSANVKPAEDVAAPRSETATLRDEIDATENPQERARLQLRLAEQLIAAGKKQDALAELQLMSDEDRFDPPHFYNVANAMARIGATDAAIKTYRKAIEQRKGHYSRASNNLGVVLMRQGFWDQAYEALLTALRQENFHYAEASYNLGRLYDARGEVDLAVREWHRAVTVDPEHSAAKLALARVSARDSITVVPSRAPGRVTIEKSSGSSLRPAGNESRSRLSSSGGALTVDEDTFSFLQRARSARERSLYPEAVTNYRRVISRMGGYFSAANLEMSYALMNLKRNDEAVEALLPVTQRDGTRFPISYYHLGRLYEARGDLPRAEESFGKAAEFYRGNNSQFLLDLSRVREKRGNLSGALDALEQSIKSEEQRGKKPEWSAERLATLRGKMAASQPKQ